MNVIQREPRYSLELSIAMRCSRQIDVPQEGVFKLEGRSLHEKGWSSAHAARQAHDPNSAQSIVGSQFRGIATKLMSFG